MGFIEDIKNCFSLEEFPSKPTYRAVLFGDTAGYFENVLGIISYTKEEIALSIKNGRLIIRGEGLYVKKFCVGDIVVCGKILSLERV